MEFKRILNDREIVLLGNDPHQRLHGIIDDLIKRLSNVKDVQSVESRIISLMSTTPMNTRDMMAVHNAVYGGNPITLAYTRFVVNGMYHAGLINRVSRGKYIKVDPQSELTRVNNAITMIEMTGRTTGREQTRYQQLLTERKGLMS